MKHRLLVVLLAGAGVIGLPARAEADLTFFLGTSPTPEWRSTAGFSAGISMLIVGFEFDYSNTAEKELDGAPGLRTGMLNGLLMTPTKTQLYLTAGGGFYQERLTGVGDTSWGTSIGGGMKIPIVGPVRIRVDYRVFNLRGGARYKNPQRFYVGVNFAF